MNWSPLDEIALLIAVTASLAYFNHYVLRLPRNVGLLVLGLVISVALRVVEWAEPSLALAQQLRGLLASLNFPTLLLHGVLAFLLFAGAIDTDLDALLKRKWTILALATFGVFLSTLLIGAGMWLIFGMVGLAIPLTYCFVFGALISPTDPITVLDVLASAPVPDRLRALIAGESMFNDGIGIVLYTLFLQAAAGGGGAAPGPETWAIGFVREAGGGAVIGLILGFAGFAALRGIDEYGIEIMISLALAAGAYGLAETLDASGPVATVVAGLIIGSFGMRYAVSETTHGYLKRFWSVIDQLLNALLFLLVGFEFATVALDGPLALASLLAVPLALAARVVSIAVPGLPLNIRAEHKLRGIWLMTWSGLRGGISLALALSLTDENYRDPLIAVTYAVVIFTMLVQGLSLNRVACWLYPPNEAADAEADKSGVP